MIKKVYCLVSESLNFEPELKLNENYVHAVCKTLEECEDWKQHYDLVFCDMNTKIVETNDQRFLDFFNK